MARTTTTADGGSKLLALLFDDPYKADDVRALIHRLESDGLSEMDEAAVIVRKADGRTRVTQDLEIIAEGRPLGHVASLVASALTGTAPFVLVGTAVGRVIGRLNVHGLTNRFVQGVGRELRPGTSALILLVRSNGPHRNQVVERLRAWQPRILESDLPPELEADIVKTFQAV